MKAHETPNGTRMMWNAKVNAIWARAHGTGSTASSAFTTEAHRADGQLAGHETMDLRAERPSQELKGACVVDAMDGT
jgi:hypothetical protein